MIDKIRVMLGDCNTNYTDAQIKLAYSCAVEEIENYCNRKFDCSMGLVAVRMAVIKLLRTGAEGISSQSFSGVSEDFIDGYPQDIQKILNSKRKIKTL